MEGLLFSSIFWGGILILWGILTIISGIFNLHIPTFSIIIAFVFIYVGIMVLSGGFKVTGKADANTLVFSEGRMGYSDKNEDMEYNVIFGKGVIDLTKVQPDSQVNVKVHTVFGEGIVQISSDIPVKITANAAFGSANLPDESVTSFGKHIYKSANFNKDQKYLNIEADSVFGSLRIETRK